MPSEKTMLAKQEQVRELAQKLKEAKGMVLADYRGLTVEQDTKLRKELREAESSIKSSRIPSFISRPGMRAWKNWNRISTDRRHSP